jgi:hypothetical protein
VSTQAAAAAELDLAIDALLADRRPAAGPLDADLVATARLLRDRLPRYHPRFGFEERLLRRLVSGGSAPALIVRLPELPREVETAAADPGARHAPRRRRLASGALASSVSLVIPLAGAALVAWRRGRLTGGGA